MKAVYHEIEGWADFGRNAIEQPMLQIEIGSFKETPLKAAIALSFLCSSKGMSIVILA
jgi:hypothetical protein